MIQLNMLELDSKEKESPSSLILDLSWSKFVDFGNKKAKYQFLIGRALLNCENMNELFLDTN